jgi:riboflavin synthase
MFSGIIEELGRVREARPEGGGRRLTIAADLATEVSVDQSISINGACHTVVDVLEGAFAVTSVEETLSKTNIGQLAAGDRVNLERALAPTGRLDGHIVQGHVDSTGQILSVERLETSHLISVGFDQRFASMIVPVGSIAVDGISLTVARLLEDRFQVAIIPYTFDVTNVASWTPGHRVNLEFDIIGKYVIRWLERRETGSQQPPARLTEEWLRDQGLVQ